MARGGRLQTMPKAGTVRFGSRSSRGKGYPSPRPSRTPPDRGVHVSYDTRPNGAFKNPAPTGHGSRPGSRQGGFGSNAGNVSGAFASPGPKGGRGNFSPRFGH